MSIEDKLRNVGFKRQTKSGGDSCMFCEYRKLEQEKNLYVCRLHNLVFEDGFEASEYICRHFQESEWLAETLEFLKNT